MIWNPAQMEIAVIEKNVLVPSTVLGRDVECTLFIPDSSGPLNLLLLNDGQEAGTLNVLNVLEDLYEQSRIRPTMVAAINAGEERLVEYGTAGIADFKGRGAKAAAYTQFVLEELLPLIIDEAGVAEFNITAFAGFSLGGLSALDICWNNADVFNKAGVFSGSLWWRAKDLNDSYTDNDRIMHRIIRQSKEKPELKFWFQTGTRDEKADRNRNGIIDAIDDTIDLIAELEKKGYSRPDDITYLEMVGGEHHISTWARAFPKFLCWAFGK